ncbi:MAG: hypothetical protein FJ271_00460 [Planctomycetes bacterium]|nr:hypothetical protein [Planctomycetota bacterium]
MHASKAVALILVIVLFTGCKKAEEAKPTGTLAGKVMSKGAAVTGGTLTFIAKDGDGKATLAIMADGSYTGSIPVGDWLVGIDTETVKQAEKMGIPETEMPTTFTPDMINKFKDKKVDPKSFESKSFKNPFAGMKYVAIPDKYREPKSSGLTVTVKEGDQLKRDFKID